MASAGVSVLAYILIPEKANPAPTMICVPGHGRGVDDIVGIDDHGTELAEPLPMSWQAVSKHLQVLERAGLVERGKVAQLRPSRLQGAPLAEAVRWLEGYRGFWDAGFDSLDERLR